MTKCKNVDCSEKATCWINCSPVCRKCFLQIKYPKPAGKGIVAYNMKLERIMRKEKGRRSNPNPKHLQIQVVGAQDKSFPTEYE